ncbi:MAG TPA: PKD domain-containing protein [Candidatus Thermoplasmatota archaeon]|nr:PKD domain-containing protein [Candidatus Thermoplasmatota archaeon]
MRPLRYLLVAVLLLLPALLTAPPALAQGPVSEAKGANVLVDVLYDASQSPPVLEAKLQYDTSYYSPKWKWHVPEGATVLYVLDEAGRRLDHKTENGFDSVTAPYPGGTGIRSLRWYLAMPALQEVPGGGGFRTTEVSIAGSSTQTVRFTVKAPPGESWLDASPSKATLAAFTGPMRPRLLFGPAAATETRETPPGDASRDILERYRLTVPTGGTPTLQLTVWANSSVWNLAIPARLPPGWEISHAADAWGPLPPPIPGTDGRFTLRARDLPGRIAVASVWFTPGPGMDHPLLTMDVPADDEDTRHYVELAVDPSERDRLALSRANVPWNQAFAQPKGFHATLDRELPGWTAAASGFFRIYGNDPTEVAFTVKAAERAAKPIREAFTRAGFPLRDQVPVVVLPDNHPAWVSPWEAGHFTAEGWGIELKRSAVRNDTLEDTPWPLAALLLHETFHVGQRDYAPNGRLTWWIEGTAEEARRAFPASVICAGSVKYKGDDCVPQRLPTPAEMTRYENGEFDIAWDEHGHVPDPAFAYAVSNFLVKSYRERAGEAAYRAVWADLAAAKKCCTVAELTTILQKHAPSLSRADIERPFLALRASDPDAYRAAVDAMLAFKPWPGTAPEPPQPLVVRVTAEPAAPVVRDAVQLKATARGGSGGVVSWAWSFGDGSTTTGSPLVSKRYGAPGEYLVRVVATDAQGERAEGETTVTVLPPALIVNFTVSPASPTTERELVFDPVVDGTTGAPRRIEWDFGDGRGGAYPAGDVAHRYDAPGTYRVNLTYVDADGRTAKASQVVVLVPRPFETELVVTPLPPRAGVPVAFTRALDDPDHPVVRFTLDFGDGEDVDCTPATCLEPVKHTYAQPGPYTATLTVYNAHGNSAKATREIEVLPASAVAPSGTTPEVTTPAEAQSAAPEPNAVPVPWPLALLALVGAALALGRTRK